MSRNAIAALVCLLLGLASQAIAQARLLPVDEAARDPEFFSVRAQILSAIARRDTAALMAFVSPQIKTSFGNDHGSAEFRRTWRLGSPGSTLWGTLGEALALGGSLDPSHRFAAPYVFSRWPQKYDAFEHVAVIGSKVRIRAAPRATSATIATSDFGILALGRPLRPDGAAGWTSVRLPDGRQGYVASRFVRSPVGYRAIFERAGGQWKMVVFIAGD